MKTGCLPSLKKYFSRWETLWVRLFAVSTVYKCSLNMLLTMVCVCRGWMDPAHRTCLTPLFYRSSVKTVSANGYHSVWTWLNRQESLKDGLQYIYHLPRNVASSRATSTHGVFPPNNGSIWAGRWMVVQAGSFWTLLLLFSIFYFFFERLENLRFEKKREDQTPGPILITLWR